MPMQTGRTGAHGHAHGSACSARDRASELMCGDVTLLIVKSCACGHERRCAAAIPRSRMLRCRGVDLHHKYFRISKCSFDCDTKLVPTSVELSALALTSLGLARVQRVQAPPTILKHRGWGFQ